MRVLTLFTTFLLLVVAAAVRDREIGVTFTVFRIVVQEQPTLSKKNNAVGTVNVEKLLLNTQKRSQ